MHERNAGASPTRGRSRSCRTVQGMRQRRCAAQRRWPRQRTGDDGEEIHNVQRCDDERAAVRTADEADAILDGKNDDGKGFKAAASGTSSGARTACVSKANLQELAPPSECSIAAAR